MHVSLTRQKVIAFLVLYYGFYLLFYQDFLAGVIIQSLGTNAYFVIDLLVYVIMFILFALIGWRFYQAEIEHFKENRSFCMTHVFYGTCALFVTNIVLSQFIYMFFPDAIADNQTNNDIYMSMNQIGYIFSACLFAPFLEETVFRGCIFSSIKEKHGFAIASIVSASLFGLLHIAASLIQGNWANCIYFVIYAACGFVLCIPYEDTGNFFTSVLTHMFYNTLGIIMTLWLS